MGVSRAIAYIDLGALEENLAIARSRLAAGVKMLCVVKADAYGHGAIEVSRRLERLNVDYLGVASVEEGIQLRVAGIKTPILVMSGPFPWDALEPAVMNDLSLVFYDVKTLKRIGEESPSLTRPVRAHIKIDTGMGRLGFSVADMAFVGQSLKNMGNVACEGLMSHFSASETRDDYGLKQVALFREAQAALIAAGIRPKIAHMANSGAIINYPDAHFDMVRAGIGLYGSHPSIELAQTFPIKQVMKFVSRVALVRDVPAGYSLSYGRTFITSRNTKVAYVPVGYADGYPRALSNKAFVLIKQRKCSIVGTVCMDWILVDITDINGVDVADEVVLLGRDGGQAVTADELARYAGTIPYEILCKISKRVPRVYV
ncbi:MAG TPA: alanine racemase [Syntrophorhabdaceae bacterium]|nr:alanine racemase [Syntrophorhabdaceae bacterium]